MLALCCAACAPPSTRPDASQLLDFDEAVTQTTAALADQLHQQAGVVGQLATAVGKPVRHVIVVDPMIDGSSGQHTALSVDLELRVLSRIAEANQDLQVIRFSPGSLQQAEFLLTGTIALEAGSKADGVAAGAPADIRLAVTNLKTGQVVAQAGARVKNPGFDLTPNAFERDSPVVLLDEVVEGYIRTCATPAGQAADAAYLRHLEASIAIAEGTEAYNQAHYTESLQHFQAAVSGQSGDQLRALNGTYLADVRLGRLDQAEAAFGRIVAFGIAHRDLGVKLLFNPRTTDFWSDRKVSGLYDMWLRQIARGLGQAEICVEIAGHASHTGSDVYNDKLSERRADLIRQRLLAEDQKLAGRVTIKGLGFRENIVGIGTDDARDAVDRRVSFKFQDCHQGQ